MKSLNTWLAIAIGFSFVAFIILLMSKFYNASEQYTDYQGLNTSKSQFTNVEEEKKSDVSLNSDTPESKKMISLTLDNQKWKNTTVFDQITFSYPPELQISFPDDPRGYGVDIHPEGYISSFFIVKVNLIECLDESNCDDLSDLSRVSAKEYYDIQLKRAQKEHTYLGEVKVGNKNGMKIKGRLSDSSIFVLNNKDVFEIYYLEKEEKPILNQDIFNQFLASIRFQ